MLLSGAPYVWYGRITHKSHPLLVIRNNVGLKHCIETMDINLRLSNKQEVVTFLVKERT